MYRPTMASTRRNGQLSSCEPCRKSKLRCDHATPVCGRCIRRGRTNACVYHPAPLTQDPSLRPPKRRHRTSNDPETISLGQPPIPTPPTRSPDSSILPSSHEANWNQKRSLITATGFLGLTSHSAVFSENDLASTFQFNTANAYTAAPDAERVELGAQALRLLAREMSFYEKILEARFKIWVGWVLGCPIVSEMFASIKNTLRHWISGEDEESAVRLSMELFKNGITNVEVSSSMTYRDYISRITCRWETIGALFSIIGLATRFMPYVDPDFFQGEQYDPEGLVVTVTTAADVCLQLCDNTGLVNDPLSWLLLNQTSLLALVHGDLGACQIFMLRMSLIVHRSSTMEETRRTIHDYLRTRPSSGTG